MNYIDRNIYQKYLEFKENKNSICAQLNLHTLETKYITHPIYGAALYLRSQLNNENYNYKSLYEIVLAKIEEAFMPTGIKELDVFFEDEMKVYGKKVLCLIPNDRLIGDFANTTPPKGGDAEISEFLKNTNVLIEFPLASSVKGIYLEAIYIESGGGQRHCYTGNSGISPSLENEIKNNSKQFRSKMDDLIKMILLFYISVGFNKIKKSIYLNQNSFKTIKKDSKLKAKIKKVNLIPKIQLEAPSFNIEWRNKLEKRTWNLLTPFEVRGHWRWQAHGEQHSKRKLIWIESHVKGAVATQ